MIEKLKKYEAIVASGEIGAGTRNEVAVLLGRAANAIEARDTEIEELKKENAQLRVIVSGATVADGNLREEIERLREIVKELADELETMICNEIVKSSKRRVK